MRMINGFFRDGHYSAIKINPDFNPVEQSIKTSLIMHRKSSCFTISCRTRPLVSYWVWSITGHVYILPTIKSVLIRIMCLYFSIITCSIHIKMMQQCFCFVGNALLSLKKKCNAYAVFEKGYEFTIRKNNE